MQSLAIALECLFMDFKNKSQGQVYTLEWEQKYWVKEKKKNKTKEKRKEKRRGGEKKRKEEEEEGGGLSKAIAVKKSLSNNSRTFSYKYSNILGITYITSL